MAEPNNLTWYKATAGTQPFTVTPPVNIAAWDGFIVFTMRKNATDAAAVIGPKNCPVADAANGIFNLTLSKADTQSLEAGDYAYDIQRTNAGAEDVLSIGTFTLLQEVRIP